MMMTKKKVNKKQVVKKSYSKDDEMVKSPRKKRLSKKVATKKVSSKKSVKKKPTQKVNKKSVKKTPTQKVNKKSVKKHTITKKSAKKATKKSDKKATKTKSVKSTTTKKTKYSEVAKKISKDVSPTKPKKGINVKHEKQDADGNVVKKVVKRKRGKSKMYFTQETEDAIVLYNNTECEFERERIYREKILEPFKKLAENVFNTFKFSYFDTDPQDVQRQVVSELTYKINKYKPQSSGGGKAFSYFSIIAKNWLILYNNSMFKKWKQHTEILDAPEEDTSGEILVVEADNTDEIKEFNELMINYWETNLTKVFTKKKEIEIANAVIELFRNSDRLENFNKKALYLYIREISGCKTQNITRVINKMKDYQRDIFDEYLSHGMVTVSNSISDGDNDDSFFDEY